MAQKLCMWIFSLSYTRPLPLDAPNWVSVMPSNLISPWLNPFRALVCPLRTSPVLGNGLSPGVNPIYEYFEAEEKQESLYTVY
jgi:hypothetical protein